MNTSSTNSANNNQFMLKLDLSDPELLYFAEMSVRRMMNVPVEVPPPADSVIKPAVEDYEWRILAAMVEKKVSI